MSPSSFIGRKSAIFRSDSSHLSSSDGVILYKDRIVVPPSLRPRCLSALHAAHQGTSAMTARVESSIFWPGISSDIQATIARCNDCNRTAPSQASLPPTPPTRAEYPFQCLCADYFHHSGHTYLVSFLELANCGKSNRRSKGSDQQPPAHFCHLWHP